MVQGQKPKRILLLDDNERVIEFFPNILETDFANVKIVPCNSIKKANAIDPKTIDVAIVDWQIMSARLSEAILFKNKAEEHWFQEMERPDQQQWIKTHPERMKPLTSIEVMRRLLRENQHLILIPISGNILDVMERQLLPQLSGFRNRIVLLSKLDYESFREKVSQALKMHETLKRKPLQVQTPRQKKPLTKKPNSTGRRPL